MALELTAIVLELSAGKHVQIPRHMGHATKRLFLRNIIHKHNPDVARKLISGRGPKPYTATGLMQHERQFPVSGDVQKGDRAWIRYTGLHWSVTQVMLEWAMAHPPVVDIDGIPWVVENIHLTKAGHPGAGNASYLTITEKTLDRNPLRSTRINFIQPTAFQSSGISVPFPLPKLVFGSLIRDWYTFSNIRLSPLLEDFIEHFVMLNRYTLDTKTLSYKNSDSIVGFVGNASYTVAKYNQRLERTNSDRHSEIQQKQKRLIQTLHLLAEYSFFSGVGIKTTTGMGMARRVVGGV